ncbi:hypothetical protein BpHYR1_006189 [Brachionus plicatilis]|uniref:Uncharacterized protein n=1 Tax=Brachionus plicatilis TaxID=10195 RepID=A0A3M7SWV8_BRAPC|nr:hypothetical protein BpHYR1_006189 [Brachionus plicatilis]
MQRHNLEHIIGAGAILNLAHVKFNLTCVACAKTFNISIDNSKSIFNLYIKSHKLILYCKREKTLFLFL